MAVNSSIFNFEGVRRSLELPATVWVWHGFTLLAACATLVFCSFFLDSLRLEPPEKIKYVGGLEEAEILVLGNSECLSVRETDLGIPAKNFSLGGMGYVLEEIFFDSLTPKMKNLNTLMIGFDPIQFLIPFNEREGDFRDLVRSGLSLADIPGISDLDRLNFLLRFNRISKPLLVGPKLTVENFPKADFAQFVENFWTPLIIDHRMPERNVTIYANYSLPKVRNEITNEIAIAKAAKYIKAFRRETHLDSNKESFFRILDRCAARDISVILLIPPTHEAFRSKMEEKWGGTLSQILDEAHDRFGDRLSIEVYDPGTWTEQDLWDPNHLNAYSSRTYSANLRERLHKLRASKKEDSE
ncbi:MAG: hypothetical protein KC917_00560 [Candidatus Omnitrophica bacterium]|nr:hypothetical protein [Candidatus Omnitrophota bacterium]